jgi:hypothetical protein
MITQNEMALFHLVNRYRLTMIDDRQPKFFINDTLQLDTEADTTLVDKLAQLI